VVDFGFNYHGENIKLDVQECKNISSQFRGLMFRKKSKPLLFLFKKIVDIPIHSFFCKPFIAVWFNDDEVIEVKRIDNWKFSIKPEKGFNKLLEIPLGDNNSLKFIDG